MTSSDNIIISAQMRLSANELAETLALKQVCDDLEGLTLKLGYGATDPDATRYDAVYLARAGAQLIGYGSLEGDETTAELGGMVHPEWRRRQVGQRLFAAAQASFAAAGGERLFAVCEDGSASGRGFMRAQGGLRDFAEHHMVWRRTAAPPPAPVAFSVERARPEDLQPLAMALSHAFDHSEARLLADLTSAAAFATELVYVGRLAGVVIGGFRLSAGPDTTGIYAFGVDRAYQRRGLGRAMLGQACALAAANGAARVSLEVDTDNMPAIALYQSSGFETVTTYAYYIFPSARPTVDQSDGLSE